MTPPDEGVPPDAPKRGPDKGYADGSFPDGRMNAPAALRNRDAITNALTQIAPASGRALELASGTGQHVIHFARAMPGLTWQPTDPAADRRASIVAWQRAEPSSNLLPPLPLDACTPGWAADHGPADLIFVANLLHLVSEGEARICLTEMAKALAPGGCVAIYGPFLRDGVATSEGDAAFDARIRAEMPDHGYKDLDWTLGTLTRAGLVPDAPLPMPANNLLMVARKH
ncbi:DUF938 domain-containing protein [Hasllibacter sp. MH4015]|uniref:DUF938 domain-containing protein n=1 Tax=Hasllibacter sp. MH4015 TaxID=2854029 RepID=UPI001CD637FA|nr:DUF938 domain-containing protein [Hasllibacter sp. MH4015]